MITILIVDDQPLQRLGFRMLLESQPDMTVAGEAGKGSDAVRMVQDLRPDVVLMDVRMPGMDGVAATGHIVSSGSPARILVLTTFDLDEYAFAALRAGASGFLVKTALPEELLAGIRAVAVGDAVVAPSVTRRLLDRFVDRLPGPATTTDHPDPRLAALSLRETQVLTAIALGRTNTEIAAELVLAESTVKTHIGRILAKIDARDRVQAVIFAYDTGLVTRG